MNASTEQIIKLSEYREPQWRIVSTHLTVSIWQNKTCVTNVMQLERLDADATELLLNGEDLNDVSVQVNGQPATIVQLENDPSQWLLKDIPAQATVTVDNWIVPEQNRRLMGLYYSGGNYCTQCEAEGFRRITLYPDRPDYLTEFTCRIEANRSFPQLLCNGNLIESGDIDAERHYAVWHDPFLKPCYLFALVVADLGTLTDSFTTCSGREVELRLYAPEPHLERLQFSLQALKDAMTWDEQAYGREYDLDNFMIVAVDDFIFGAMENKGLNVFNTSALLCHPDTTTDASYARIRRIVAHEYFHNWSGNRVTCRDWFQLSLKEGFTVFRDASFGRETGDSDMVLIDDVKVLRDHQFSEDASALAHPVRPREYRDIDNFYTATVYEKGAEIVGMYRTILGAANFRRATDDYFETHDGTGATIEDFLTCMEKNSGTDLQKFSQWYDYPGTPRVSVTPKYDASARTLTVTIEQILSNRPSSGVSVPLHIPLRVGLVGTDGEQVPAQLEGDTDNQQDQWLLELTERKQSWHFTGLDSQPVLSVNRGFSAPVIVESNSQDENSKLKDLQVLARYDSDAYVRYASLQQLYRECLKAEIAGEPSNVPAVVDIIETILQDDNISYGMRARLLSVPQDIAKDFRPYTIGADVKAYRKFKSELARGIKQSASALYDSLHLNTKAFDTDALGIGSRALQAELLTFLVVDGDSARLDDAASLCSDSDNISLRLAGIRALSFASSLGYQVATELHGRCLEQLLERFREEPIAVNNYLAIMLLHPVDATLDALTRVATDDALMVWTNPNRVRAVWSSFSANQVAFHRADGAGYQAVAGAIAKMDAINPAIAANLSRCFSEVEHYPDDLKSLARESLEQLGQGSVSKQLREHLDKMIG